MYVGRIVAVGRTGDRSWVGYRVSSRSFPNRLASLRGKSVLVSPKDPLEMLKNPYITYSCIKVNDYVAVVANGSHSEMIIEKIEDGMRPLDAISQSLVAFGYERDELNTPRICGAVLGTDGWLGIAQKDEIRIKMYHLENCCYSVATYEMTDFFGADISGKSSAEIARAMFESPFERPVCSGAALSTDQGFELAVYHPE